MVQLEAMPMSYVNMVELNEKPLQGCRQRSEPVNETHWMLSEASPRTLHSKAREE